MLLSSIFFLLSLSTDFFLDPVELLVAFLSLSQYVFYLFWAHLNIPQIFFLALYIHNNIFKHNVTIASIEYVLKYLFHRII